MPLLPGYHVARARLTDRVLDASVSVVIAGGGYGKSALAAECRDRLGVPVVSTVLEPGGAPAALTQLRGVGTTTWFGTADLAMTGPETRCAGTDSG